MRLRSLIAVAALLLSGSLARAEDARTPRAALEEANQEISRLLSRAEGASGDRAAAVERLRLVVEQHFAIERMARDAMGSHWSSLNDEQRREYIDLLRQLMVQALDARFDANLRFRLRLGAVSVDVQRARVEAVVTLLRRPNRQTLLLAFHFERSPAGWRIVEIETDGVHLVRGYRLQFHRIIVSHGVNALLQRMRERLADH